MNKITNSESEVQAYPFTTQSLWVGHTYYKNIKWQVIDTPGVLDRPLEERNTIEMQAITAMAHLDAAMLYFVDISEACGYSIDQQVKLFTSIKPLFKNKPLIIVLNKIDIRPFADLNDEEKALLEATAKEHNTYLIQMSNETNHGVIDVKATSCDILLDYRIASKTQKKGDKVLDNALNKLYIATPTQFRDNKKRPPIIPDSVHLARSNEIKEEVDFETAEKNLMKYGEDYGFEKTIKFNRVKELMEQNGGDGVFFISDRGKPFI